LLVAEVAGVVQDGQGRYLLSPMMMSRQMSRPMKSARVSGPIGWAMPSFMTLSMASRSATPFHQAVDRLVDHGHQHAVADEAGVVLHRDRVLPSSCAGLRHELERGRAGGLAADDLDQLHHRHRVHEVHADDAVGARVVAAIFVTEMLLVFVASTASAPQAVEPAP
jgi:hypothetical protein